MGKLHGQCSIGACTTLGEARELPYWPGGMKGARGTQPRVPVCETHWLTVQAKMADPLHWRSVYSGGVLSFRPTGVSPAS